MPLSNRKQLLFLPKVKGIQLYVPRKQLPLWTNINFIEFWYLLNIRIESIISRMLNPTVFRVYRSNKGVYRRWPPADRFWSDCYIVKKENQSRSSWVIFRILFLLTRWTSIAKSTYLSSLINLINISFRTIQFFSTNKFRYYWFLSKLFSTPLICNRGFRFAKSLLTRSFFVSFVHCLDYLNIQHIIKTDLICPIICLKRLGSKSVL